MVKFDHFILTRFNLRVSNWSKTKNDEPTLTKEWMDHRFDLFEKYCLPSIRNQSDQGFKWLVYFDTSTIAEFRDRVKQIDNEFEQFIPLYKDGLMDFLNTHQNDVLQLMDSSASHIITSRLDNDDMLHRDFVRRLKSEAMAVSEQVIDCRKGFQVLLEFPNKEVRVKVARYNHFISLVKSADNFETVMSRKHKAWKNTDLLTTITDQKMWVELVHDKNALNQMDAENKRFKF